MTRVPASALIALALLVPAACQGGGNGDGELARDEFIRQADAICVAANREIARLPAPSLADPEAAPATIRELVSIQRAARERLSRLEPPAPDVPAIKEWLRYVDRALDQAARAAGALERDERDTVNDANAKGTDAQLQADELARQYGLTRCAVEDPEPPTST